MSFFTKIGNFFRGRTDDEVEEAAKPTTSSGSAGGGGGGFSVRKEVAVPVEPLITLGGYGGGGVQGLYWYVKNLHQDDDGNVADAFYEEKPPAVVWVIPPGVQSRPVSWSRLQVSKGDVLQMGQRDID
mmetsp:Transcript_22648/g.49617  ORF Transcript_22648/g.49617 Transcript_22648/m.49617 type:complete len:128 (-) Transcript_22648:567-950(-)